MSTFRFMNYKYVSSDNVTRRKLDFCEEKDAAFVLVPISEMRGFFKALRLIKEKSLDALKADKKTDGRDQYGYKVVRMQYHYKRFMSSREADQGLSFVTYLTPYNANKIDVDTANSLIMDDFAKHYNYPLVFTENDRDQETYSDIWELISKGGVVSAEENKIYFDNKDTYEIYKFLIHCDYYTNEFLNLTVNAKGFYEVQVSQKRKFISRDVRELDEEE